MLPHSTSQCCQARQLDAYTYPASTAAAEASGSLGQIVVVHMQVKMRDLLVRVGRYPCGSLDVEVSSSGLAIADRRHMPHMPHHLSIITITPDQPDGATNTSDVFAPWDTVRSFVASNTTMPEFSRLAHLSSFERRHSVRRVMSSVSSVLSHRRSSHDRRSSDDRHDRTGK